MSTDSVHLRKARQSIGKLGAFQRMLTEAQAAIDSQAQRVAEALTELTEKDAAALEDPITIAWVSHWAYTGLPLMGVELPDDVMDIITSYDQEADYDAN